jgi:hypothetical protein
VESSSPYVPILIALLAGGVAGGVAGRLSVPTAKAKTATAASAEPTDTSELAAKVDKLERTVASLERERRVTRAALARSLGQDGAEPSADGGVAAPTIDDPVFETAVRDIMEQIDEERQTERRARWEERRKQAADRWAGWLGGELGLNDDQKRKVAEVVQDYFKRMQEMRNSDAGPMSRSERREQSQALRTESEKKLGQVLDPSQMEKYRGLDDDQKIGFGFGGGRRRGGGPGGPGN